MRSAVVSILTQSCSQQAFSLFCLSSALPSAPRNLTHSVDKTSVTLYWTTPISTGSRDDVYYLVSCLSQSQGVLYKPSSNVTATLVTVSGLTPFTNHTLTVTALNGVASEDNRNYWRGATVSVLTPQAGKCDYH